MARVVIVMKLNRYYEIEVHRRRKESLWALIDLADKDFVERYHWNANIVKGKYPYAYATIAKIDDEWELIHLHTLLTGWSFVDHINHNSLDNRRSNLRESSYHLNGANRRKQKGTSSIYKGVCRIGENKWHVQIKVNQKMIHLGYFTDEIEGAMAYDRAAIKAWGEHANPNFIEVDGVYIPNVD